jgi:hypothetical protein
MIVPRILAPPKIATSRSGRAGLFPQGLSRLLLPARQPQFQKTIMEPL